MDVGVAIRQAHKNYRLVELVVRESIGGFQAIVKCDENQCGPWGIGMDEDPIRAIEEAMRKGAVILEKLRVEATKPKQINADDLL